MINSKMVTALGTLAILVGCAQKPIQLTEVKYGLDSEYVPYDFIGATTSPDGRIPAQAGGVALVKFIEGSLGEAGHLKLVENINKVDGALYKELGLSRPIKSVYDLNPAQRNKVLQKFTQKGSAVYSIFSYSDDLQKLAINEMNQAGVVAKKSVQVNIKGPSGVEFPHTGGGRILDQEAYNLQQAFPKNGKVMVQEITTLNKNLIVASKNRPALNSFKQEIALSNTTFGEATGELLLNPSLCKNGAVEFSEPVIGAVTATSVETAELAAKFKVQNPGVKLSDEVAAGYAIKSHKSNVPGSTCLRSFQAVKNISDPKGACPWFSNKIGRGIAQIKDLAVHCK